jgi:Rrf2 family protein
MKILNREVDYAVRALVLMTRANKPNISVTQMEEETGVSRPFLRKILQKLHKAGILRAIKGKGGGFTPARAPENIRLSDLAEALQGRLQANDCMAGGKLCKHHSGCRLRHRMGDLERHLTEELQSISIRELAGA